MPRNRTLDVRNVVPEGLTSADRSVPGSDPSLVDWIRVALDGWQALAISVAVGLALGVLATLLQSEKYRATGSIVVTPAQFLDPNSADQLPTLTNTVQRLAGTTAVLGPTATRYIQLARDPVTRSQRRSVASPDWVGKHIKVRQQGDSSIIEISGTVGTQRDASDLTRATVTTLASVVNNFDSPAGQGGAAAGQGGAGGINIKVFTLARERGKVSPTPVRNLVIGLNLGLIVGIVAALLLGMSRSRLRRPSEIASVLEVPLLGDVDLASHPLDADPGILQAATALERTWGQDAQSLVLVTGTLDSNALAVVTGSLTRALVNVGMDASFVDTTQAVAAKAAVAEEDVLVGIQGGRWSQATPISRAEARRPAVSFDDLVNPNRLVLAAGPGLSEPFELARLAHQADVVIVVTHRGVPRDDLRSARVLEPKIAGALVVG